MGKSVAMLVLFMAVLTLVIVVLRYVFDIGSIALQESVLYMHATLIMLGLSYALQTDSHVRVDIVYARLKPNVKRLINLGGHALFLIPFAILLIVYSWDYVLASWRVQESSPEVGGIPGIYLLKSLIPLSATLLILQSLCEIARLLFGSRQAID
ncbi:MAG: TRAP transporter small permease subunit [Gammaproteobacteria bacterium]|nr:TRAP transporter small permease subunit [Gammaproteobacteria bacterium]